MTSFRAGRILTALTCWLALGSAPALATTHTWIGGAGGNWSVSGNWAGGVPTSGESGLGTVVEFGSNSSSVMNIAGLTVDQIHFTGTNNVISGSAGIPLSVSGSVQTNNILADATGNSLAASLPITLAGLTTVFARCDTGTLTIAGSMGGLAGFRSVGVGANGITLTGANTYLGSTTVGSGTLHLNDNGVNTAVTGSVVNVGTGSGPGGVLVLDQSHEIADATNVVVWSDGTLNSNNRSETVNALTVTNGAVTMGTVGGLSPNGTLTMSGGTISGTGTSGLALKADVVATSSSTQTATISALTSLNGARAFTVNDGAQATDLELSNVISDGAGASSFSKAGAGTLLLSTPNPGNTWTGGTTVRNGVLLLNGTSSTVVPAGPVTVGDGTGAASSAVLRLGQLQEISAVGAFNVVADGLFDLAGFSEGIGALTVSQGGVQIGLGTLQTGPLTIADGTITLTSSGNLSANGLTTLTGGTIGGGGTGLFIPGDIVATSSAAGPATVGVATRLSANRTITVNTGTPPELRLTGGINDAGAALGITKAGPGTLLDSGSGTYTGATSITAGTLVADGASVGAFQVAPGATLAGKGSVGATTVAGTLAPSVPGLTTGPLAFSATGRLAVDVPSTVAGAYPSVSVTGTATIDPAATLALTFAPAVPVPATSNLVLLANDGADAVTGQFANAPATGSVTVAGLPVAFRYNGGTGNDLDVTAANAAPVIGSITATPNPAGTGQKVTLSVVATDANNDPLAVLWAFGDGAVGSGTSTSHVFAVGPHTVTATVSDGKTQVQATKTVTTKDTVKPKLTKLKLSPATFKALAAGGSLSTAKTGGAKVTFTLSEAARMTFTVEQQQTGRLVGGTCVKRTGANAKKRSCKRFVTLSGSFATAGRLGANGMRFTGRLRSKRLVPGAYRLVLTARDAAGNTSSATRLSFKIVK